MITQLVPRGNGEIWLLAKNVTVNLGSRTGDTIIDRNLRKAAAEDNEGLELLKEALKELNMLNKHCALQEGYIYEESALEKKIADYLGKN